SPPNCGARMAASSRPACRLSITRNELNGVALVALAKAVRDKGFERVESGFGIRPFRLDQDAAAGGCGEHHQPHDRCAGHCLAFARNANLGVELLRHLHKLRGGARVKAACIYNVQKAVRRARPAAFVANRHVPSPARTRLAMEIYLRPDSWA